MGLKVQFLLFMTVTNHHVITEQAITKTIISGVAFCRLIRRPEHLIGNTLVSPGKLKVIHFVIT
jgi:hypothetical protein